VKNKNVNTLDDFKALVKHMAPMIGMTVTDKISGITGVVRGVKVLYSGCEHILVQRKGTDTNGDPIPPLWLDLAGLENYQKLPKNVRHELLGVKVRDVVADYDGICTAVAVIEGTDLRIYIQGKSRTDEGVPSPEHICDLAFIERKDKEKVKKAKASGAPAFLGRSRNATLR
jgi:hypothetical protein